jgi:hypothetical protein
MEPAANEDGPSNAAGPESNGMKPLSWCSDSEHGRFSLEPHDDPEQQRFQYVMKEHRHTLGFSAFVRKALNGQRLPRPDIQRLLDWLHGPDFNASKLSVQVAELKKFVEEHLHPEEELGFVDLQSYCFCNLNCQASIMCLLYLYQLRCWTAGKPSICLSSTIIDRHPYWQVFSLNLSLPSA